MNIHLNAPSQISRQSAPPSVHLLARRASLRVGLCFAVWLVTMAEPAQAGVTEAWVHRYSNVVSNSTDVAVKIARGAAGDIIVTGNTVDDLTGSDMLTIKYSGANGSVVWRKRYNGPANGHDEARAVALDASGNAVVTGSSRNGSNEDCYTAKYAAADGALLWEKRYNGPANDGDRGVAVAVDGNGNAVVTGISADSGGSYGYYTAKYAAADGALLWEQRYRAEFGNAGPSAVALDASGNVVVTGTSDNRDSVNYGGSDYYTAKYAAADGALLWEKRVNGFRIYKAAEAVIVDGSGNVVVTGNGGTVKYAAADGTLLWSKNGGQALAVDRGGNVVVTGSGGTAKYAAADGRLLWEQDGRQAVAVDGSGNVVVTGFGGFFNRDYYTSKYAAADGALLWERRYNGPANSQDYANALAVDGSGNVVVTGSSVGSEDGEDYYTAKYAAADGAILWEQRYNGPSSPGKYNDLAQALAVDGSGNVVVTGSSDNGANTDYYTAKYARADGALLWERRYKGPANASDGASAVAVDARGNVVVTGSSVGNESGADYYTAKYAAANGALLWEKRYNGPANQGDEARALVLDASGNVVVTGFSGNGNSEDCYTAKYAATGGALLWEKRYHGPANGNDRGLAVAVDAKGNVVVTGFSNGDYHTAKYGAANGALLWEKLGPPGSASSVAVDGLGNIVVTGTSYLAISDNPDDGIQANYYTAKYAAVNGALLWERRSNGPANSQSKAQSVAVDRSGNVVVTGSSSGDDQTADYYTAKYAAADGALLWEKRGPVGAASSVAVDRSGNVVVAGTSYSDNGTADYYTAKYAASDGALLWEQRYNGGFATSLALGPNGMFAVTGFSFGDYATVVYRENLPPAITCPPNRVATFSGGGGAVINFKVTATDDNDLPPLLTCGPPSGSLFPIGQTTVTCTATDSGTLASTCSFTVTVLGALGAQETVLAELILLRGTVTDQHDRKKLDEAIEHLTKSLVAERWVDQTHLVRRHGEEAFREERETVKHLCDLIQSKKSHLPDAALQGFVNQLSRVARLLASVAIDEAITAGASTKKIDQAQKLLAKGDAESGDDKCDNGIEAYAKAWKQVARAKVSPPTSLVHGHLRLEILGEPGERFLIQASSNLADWVTIGAQTANAEGVVTFEDVDAARHSVRYYRAVSQ